MLGILSNNYTFVAKLEIIYFKHLKLRIMKIRNVVFALFIAIATFGTTAVFSQNENTNNNDETSMGSDKTTISGEELNGEYVPD
jgi:hypothetical protein